MNGFGAPLQALDVVDHLVGVEVLIGFGDLWVGVPPSSSSTASAIRIPSGDNRLALQVGHALGLAPDVQVPPPLLDGTVTSVVVVSDPVKAEKGLSSIKGE